MTRKPLVYLDVDNVLTPFDSTAINELVHKNPKFKDYKPPHGKWNWFEDPKLKELEQWIWFNLMETGLFAGLNPYPEALKAVPKLKKLATVRIATQIVPGSYWMSNRLWWLDKHFGFEPKDVAFISNKEDVDCDVLVDDRPITIRRWAKRHPQRVGILWKFERYLTPGKQPNNVIKTGDWNEVIRVVEKMRSRGVCPPKRSLAEQCRDAHETFKNPEYLGGKKPRG